LTTRYTCLFLLWNVSSVNYYCLLRCWSYSQQEPCWLASIHDGYACNARTNITTATKFVFSSRYPSSLQSHPHTAQMSNAASHHIALTRPLSHHPRHVRMRLQTSPALSPSKAVQAANAPPQRYITSTMRQSPPPSFHLPTHLFAPPPTSLPLQYRQHHLHHSLRHHPHR
jgi:hypothetical protein